MRILVWNCKETRNEDFLEVIRDLIYVHDLMILVLVEARISGEWFKMLLVNSKD